MQPFVFFQLLALLFIALKLTSTVTWSWWWVLLPLYGPGSLGLLIAGGAYLIHAYYMKTDPSYKLAHLFRQYGKALSRRS